MTSDSMVLPNYGGGSILNVINSVLKGVGAKNNHVDIPSVTAEIQQAENIILLIIDGLGNDSVQRLDKHSFLRTHFRQEITSIFPSATTAAVTTFLTGVLPQEHGLISWDSYLPELGGVVQILRWRTREHTKLHLGHIPIAAPVFNKINVPSYILLKKNLLKSPYNNLLLGKATAIGINNLSGLLRQCRKLVSVSGRKYLYAYWGEFDSFSHKFGKNNPTSVAHLKEVDEALWKFYNRIKGTNTLLIITADHGQMVTTRKKTILLNKDHQFKECLSVIPCGEPRSVICHIKPEKQQQFVQHVQKKLGQYCTLHTAQELISQGYFGKCKEHEHFRARLGDYILLPKENYVFRYFLEGEDQTFVPGHHGGLSPEEMFVPLIVVKA